MSERPPIARSLLLALAAAKLAVHALSNGPLAYGLMTDELYYLDCAKRPDWGYVDHPPLSAWLLALSTSLLGTSATAIRAFAVLSTTAALVLTGLMARELGGGRSAQGLAAGAVLASPVHLSMGGFYSMNAIDIALWALAYLLLLRLANGADRRAWLALGTVVGLGLLNKLSMSWLAGGLVAGLLATPARRCLARPWPWLAGSIALLLFTPNLLWQAAHDWPTLEFLRNSALEKQIAGAGPAAFLSAQLFTTGLPIWLVGLGWLAVSPDAARFRHLGWLVAVVLAFLASTGSSKIYYPAPALSVAIAAGGVALERAGSLPGLRHLPAAVAGVAGLVGIVAAPFVISLLPPERLIAYQRAIGAAPVTVEETERAPLHQGFAQMFHGPAATEAVAKAHATLTGDERSRVGILTTQFGETGGINFYGPALGLPPAIGTQGSYWLWGPHGVDGSLVIELSESAAALEERYEHVQRIAQVVCPYCMPYLTRKAAFVCRRPRRPLREVWPELKRYR